MLDDYQDHERKRNIRMRSIVDYSRGVIFILFGLFFFFFDKFNIQGLEYKSWYKIIGGVFFIYGIWRVYRGYKKDYYR